MKKEKDLKELIKELDRMVNKLAWHKLYEYADRLEEFVGDLEDDLLREGMLK